MKASNILAVSAALAMGLVAAAADAKDGKVQYSKHVFSPARGVICDTYGTAHCPGGTGISTPWPEKYLGPKAVSAFTKMTEGGEFDSSTFVLSNGVQCRTAVNACFTQKNGNTISEAITQRIWG